MRLRLFVTSYRARASAILPNGRAAIRHFVSEKRGAPIPTDCPCPHLALAGPLVHYPISARFRPPCQQNDRLHRPAPLFPSPDGALSFVIMYLSLLLWPLLFSLACHPPSLGSYARQSIIRNLLRPNTQPNALAESAAASAKQHGTHPSPCLFRARRFKRTSLLQFSKVPCRFRA